MVIFKFQDGFKSLDGGMAFPRLSHCARERCAERRWSELNGQAKRFERFFAVVVQLVRNPKLVMNSRIFRNRGLFKCRMARLLFESFQAHLPQL